MSLLDTASLIVTPNGYKEGKLYSVIPSDGSGDLSVTRATTATRVNSQGLVELVPYNLLSYSEQFDNAYWNKRAGISISADTTTAPNGTLTADTVNYSSGDGYTWFFDTLAPSTSYTISVYAKGSGTLTFQAYWGTGASTGSANTLTSEWQRFSFTFTTGSTTSLGDFGFFVPNTCNIWGAQLVEGSVSKDYQKTETRLNIPRLDYSNGTCPSILVEPQRTNLLDYSSSFNSGFWLTFNASVSGNTTISPSGVQDADTLTSSATTGGSVYRIVTTSGTQTISCFFKAGTSNVCNIGFSNGWYAEYNLSNQTYTTVGTVTASMEDYGNGWYRCIITANTTSTIVGFGNSGTTGTTLFIWGAQAELGSYATSYIPTTSASVTRNADVISKTGISSLIGQTEGTLFVDAYITGKDSSNGSILFATDKVSSGALIRIIYTSTNALRFDVFDGSSFQCLISAGAYNVGDRVKVAGGYKNNDFVMYVNGTQIGTDTSGSVPTTDTANINTSIYGDTNGSFVNAAALWKQRLTNTQLAQLTTI